MFSLERDNETIAAICTPSGAGAIAVVRVSGDQVIAICRKMAPFLPANLESHRIYYGHIIDPESQEPLDEVLISYFSKGRSFTSENTIEISCHGGTAVVGQVLQAALRAGARMAGRGEFTYRAFQSGRIDLVQAEAVLALIESRSKAASKLALRQLQGEVSRELSEIENGLTWVLSRLEANIDFSAEFIEFASENEIVEKAGAVLSRVQKLLKSYSSGRIIKEGLRVALIGPPNVGKSSLLNALAAQDRVIVSPIAGTTRDTIEIEISLGGHRVVVIDTAGLRPTEDQIEVLGVARTRQAAAEADVICLISDASARSEMDAESLDEFSKQKVIRVANKADLLNSPRASADAETLFISAVTGAGLEKLKEELLQIVCESSDSEDAATIQSARQYAELVKAEASLDQGLKLLRDNMSPEFVISEIQEALFAIFHVAGKQVDDQVLDRVFQDFCLGK